MTPKQARFVDEYLIDLNATQAAIRAGYAESGASVEGARLLANAKIAEEITARIAERSQEAAVDALWVLKEAADVYQAARKADKLPVALKALELVGKHIDVAAFREQVDHRLSMRPEEARSVIANLLSKHSETTK